MKAWILVILVLAGLPCPAKQPVKDDIPAIAQILGIRVGKDTMETLEKRLGPGAVCVGGHPSGGRAWFIKGLNVYVYADGFDYSDDGRLIDNLVIAETKEDARICPPYGQPMPPVPKVNPGKLPLGWLGRVLPGDYKAAVLNATTSLPSPKLQGHTLYWKAAGEFRDLPIVNLRPGMERTNWYAKLTFKDGKVTVVEVYLYDH